MNNGLTKQPAAFSAARRQSHYRIVHVAMLIVELLGLVPALWFGAILYVLAFAAGDPKFHYPVGLLACYFLGYLMLCASTLACIGASVQGRFPLGSVFVIASMGTFALALRSIWPVGLFLMLCYLLIILKITKSAREQPSGP